MRHISALGDMLFCLVASIIITAIIGHFAGVQGFTPSIVIGSGTPVGSVWNVLSYDGSVYLNMMAFTMTSQVNYLVSFFLWVLQICFWLGVVFLVRGD